MLNEKIKTGLAFAIFAIVVFVLDISFVWWGLYIIISFLAYLEAAKLFKTEVNYIIYLIALLLSFTIGSALVAMIFAIIIYASYIAYKQDDLKKLLPLLYAGLGSAFIFEAYLKFELFGLLWLVLSVVLCDSFAYFVGKKYGKTSFSPSSPNKTLEGVFAGIIISTLFASFYGYYNDCDYIFSLGLSFLMAVFAVFGDLFESYLKRLAGVKDSGELFPGHGGVLDRIDALIFASAVLVILL